MDYKVHDTSIVDKGAFVGKDTRIWHWVHVCAGARVGEGCSLGQNIFVGASAVIGDCGACFTDNDELAAAMKSIRIHGQKERYLHERIGINGRLDTIQAAVLLAKFDFFQDEVVQRQTVGLRYTELLADADVVTPFVHPLCTSVFAQYTLLSDNRDHLRTELQSKGIPTAVHYPVPLYAQPALKFNTPPLPVTESVAKRVVSLPMHPFLKKEEQDCVVLAVKESCC